VGHIPGQFEAQGERMVKYPKKIRECQSHFVKVVLTKIPRQDNA